MSCIGREEPRQSKVRNFRGKVLVEKNVARFYVPVDNGVRTDLLMKKCKSTGNTHGNFDTSLPIELNGAVVRPCNSTSRTFVITITNEGIDR